ncbi:MAG: cyclopropane-fatty-acyl-phospholipid synthase family protein [Acidimicrobiales bacterium]
MTAVHPTRPAAGTASRPALDWSDLHRLPDRPVRAAIARRLFRHAVDRLPMRVVLVPTGETWGAGDAAAPVMTLVRPDAFFDRLGDSGLIGFGEAFMAGDVTAGDHDAHLVPLITILAERITDLVPRSIARLRRLGVRRRPAGEENTPTGSRDNIARHYDLSNELFASFLDPTMTYSAALFDAPLGTAAGATSWSDLEAAQHRKIDRLLDACGVGPGTSVLEIGTGWGELALRAASRGATVRSITLSEEQRDLARHRVADAGLDDRVSIELCDYRAVSGRFDAVVSVEMIEAVGAAYWGAYLSTLDRVLADGGTAAVQAITMPHQQMLATVDDQTWIHKYIFPGGMIPSVTALAEAAGTTRLRIVDDMSFGPHYAETLRLWRERFETNSANVAGFGDDPTFRRMWTFYLAYAEAGFRARYLDVHQLVFRRPA